MIKRNVTKTVFALFVFVFVLTQISAFVPEETVFANQGAPFVVMLDPGHGGNDPGVVRSYKGTDYRETDYNMALVKACRDELSKYSNVIVYQTRVADNYISTYSRAKYAADVGADLFVSFHINSSTATYVTGSSIIIPSGNYRPQLKADSSKLAEKILRNFEGIGFKYRGFETRNIENDIYLNYPDGTRGDYFEVIRRCVVYDIPSMIIEHAFITNDSDFERLNDYDVIKQLGQATASAIASQYGLKKTGQTLPQPTLYNQDSGVTVKGIPSSATAGDTVTPSATGGSGNGEYYYYVNNPYIAKSENGQIIFTGSGTCKITGGRSHDETHTPRNSSTYTVTVSACQTELELSGTAYDSGNGKCSLVLKCKPKKISGKAVPGGKVTFYSGSAVLGTGTFGDDCECTLTVEGLETENMTVSAKYAGSTYDGYKISNEPTLTLNLASVTPVPATEVPQKTNKPDDPEPTQSTATSMPQNTSENAPEATLDPDYGKITFRDVITDPDVRMIMLVAGIIICVIIIVIIIGKIKNKGRF